MGHENKHIASQNDQFRSQVGIHWADPTLKPTENLLRGEFYITAGIAALTPEQIIEIWARVRAFNDFTPDNDPYGEHNFGAFETEGVGKIFWKIDYYADEQLKWGSENPDDPTQTYRVLTVLLAEEY